MRGAVLRGGRIALWPHQWRGLLRSVGLRRASAWQRSWRPAAQSAGDSGQEWPRQPPLLPHTQRSGAALLRHAVQLPQLRASRPHARRAQAATPAARGCVSDHSFQRCLCHSSACGRSLLGAALSNQRLHSCAEPGACELQRTLSLLPQRALLLCCCALGSQLCAEPLHLIFGLQSDVSCTGWRLIQPCTALCSAGRGAKCTRGDCLGLRGCSEPCRHVQVSAATERAGGRHHSGRCGPGSSAEAARHSAGPLAQH